MSSTSSSLIRLRVLPSAPSPTTNFLLPASMLPLPAFSSRRRVVSRSGGNGGVPAAIRAMAVDSDYSSRRGGSSEPRETIMLPGCDYNHWLIVMEFPKDPAPTREQMIETYLNTLATVLGR
ncbi:hypothetical protein BHE74_00054631 [Ensete ventricosum]|uniref:Uncharacterized protein n=1 Tax=Ensete ventricosum TaxID=4639 RepID=A0A444CQ13_ENSVE|nr:hypothetical protein B296_00042098 [Ensete ventricosum]RWV87957.1 hypothetical protein GW17_00050002 [Ensete ventricosum]RWW39987.1 hypothetical protein BHE74_00054631 [Ensete ventricosum]RZS23980.1 hypothetical protein BHM03_00056994 [Ensete ventricosum]